MPKDFGKKEVVWTLTVKGQTERAYGTLKPDYLINDIVVMNNNGAGGPGGGAADTIRRRPRCGRTIGTAPTRPGRRGG